MAQYIKTVFDLGDALAVNDPSAQEALQARSLRNQAWAQGLAAHNAKLRSRRGGGGRGMNEAAAIQFLQGLRGGGAAPVGPAPRGRGGMSNEAMELMKLMLKGQQQQAVERMKQAGFEKKNLLETMRESRKEAGRESRFQRGEEGEWKRFGMRERTRQAEAEAKKRQSELEADLKKKVRIQGIRGEILGKINEDLTLAAQGDVDAMKKIRELESRYRTISPDHKEAFKLALREWAEEAKTRPADTGFSPLRGVEGSGAEQARLHQNIGALLTGQGQFDEGPGFWSGAGRMAAAPFTGGAQILEMLMANPTGSTTDPVLGGGRPSLVNRQAVDPGVLAAERPEGYMPPGMSLQQMLANPQAYLKSRGR